MASLTDLVTDTRNAARPNTAKVASPRTPGGTTLTCDNLAGWPTASKVHFVTYQIDSSSNPVAGTQLDCVGIVSGNTVTSFTIKDGTDGGNAVNDVVEMLPTAAWGQDLATALVTEHDRTGKHTNITASSITNSGNSAIGGNQTVAGTLAVTGATTLTGATTITALSNSYKFSVYRTAAWTSNNGSFGIVQFDTKDFDTGSNVDIVTNKGRFTAPVAGFYQINAEVSASVTSGSIYALVLNKNGSAFKGGIQCISAATNTQTAVYCGVVQLAANDYLEVTFFGSGGAGNAGSTVGTQFSGFLVSAT